jgi:hypothetical protein
MATQCTLHDVPGWHFLGREAALVRDLIGSGVTALGRANYADKVGDYYNAFFGLSIGLERLAKLILVVDHAVSNSGQMPDERVVRRYGHKLFDLMNAIEAVLTKYSLNLEYSRPNSPICTGILGCLDAFADAGRGRYANFVALGNPSLGTNEPIRNWWNEVGEAILLAHYYDKPIQVRVEKKARMVEAMMGSVSTVFHTAETGGAMLDIFTASVRTGQTGVVQRYGRYYALCVVRWLAEILSRLSREAFHTHHIEAFFGLWEYFYGYRVENSMLRTRKIWPLR